MRKLSLALVAAAGILAGCSGGGSKVASTVPSTGPVPTATLSASIDVSGKSQSGARNPKYIPANAASVTILTFGPNVTTGAPTTSATAAGLYTASCANIPAGTTQINMQITAPIPPAAAGASGDVFVVETTSGACGTATAIGTAGIGGTIGTGNILSSFTSAVSFPTASSTSLNAVANGGATIVLGAPVGAAAGQTTLTGSLSSLATVTAFAIDQGVKEGMLLNLVITDGNGNTLTSPAGSGSVSACGATAGSSVCAAGTSGNVAIGTSTTGPAGSRPSSTSIPLNTSLQIVVKDTKAAGNGGATGNNFAIAQIVTNKSVYDPAGTGCGGGGCANGQLIAGANAASAAGEILNITNAPAAGTGFVLIFQSVNQDVVSGATVTLQTTATTPVVLSTLTVTTQAIVQTIATAGTFANLVTPNTTGMDVVGDSVSQGAGLGSNKYVADGANGISVLKPTGASTFTAGNVNNLAVLNAAEAYNSVAFGPTNTATNANNTGVTSGYTVAAANNGQLIVGDSNCGTNGAGACTQATNATFATGLYAMNALATGAAPTNLAGFCGTAGSLCQTATGVASTLLVPTTVNSAAGGVTVGTQNSFFNIFGAPYPAGVVGVYTFPAGAPAPTLPATYYTQRMIFVAAHNSIYRLQILPAGTGYDVNPPAAVAGQAVLMAGSGNAGNYNNSKGPFTSDNANGPSALYDFGISPHIAITSNAVGQNACGQTAAAATQLYIGDYNNKRIRTLGFTPPYGVFTIGGGFGNMQGLTYEQCSGTLVVTNSNLDGNNTIFNVNASTGAVISTAVGASATVSTDGTAVAGYPLQFLAGNAMSLATGGAAYAGLALGANTSQATGLATTTNPRGIWFDPQNSYFFFLDGTATPTGGFRSIS